MAQTPKSFRGMRAQNHDFTHIEIGGESYDFNRLSRVKISVLDQNDIRLEIEPDIRVKEPEVVELTFQEALETFYMIGLCGAWRIATVRSPVQTSHSGTIMAGGWNIGLGPRISFNCEILGHPRTEGCHLDYFKSFTAPKEGERFVSLWSPVKGPLEYWPSNVSNFRYDGGSVMLVVEPEVEKLLTALDKTIGAFRTEAIKAAGLKDIGYSHSQRVEVDEALLPPARLTPMEIFRGIVRHSALSFPAG
jgi:hypothetical protein